MTRCFTPIAIILLLTITLFGQTTPDRIILNLTETPATSMAVTWHTTDQTDSARVKVAPASVWRDYQDNPQVILARSEFYESYDSVQGWHHSAVMGNLAPSAQYVYRVGSDAGWSEWNQFTTAAATAEPFSFVYLGDPQSYLRTHCSRMFREIFRNAGDAAFWMIAGDVTDVPEDWAYDELFDASGFIFRVTPSVFVPGNHETGYLVENGAIVRNDKGYARRSQALAPIWNHHLTLPENGPEGHAEKTFYLDYQGVRFIFLDTNDKDDYAAEAQWLREVLASNPHPWSILSFHRPIYPSSSYRSESDTREDFLPVIDEFAVDLVLTGHDHTYTRSPKLRYGKPVRGRKPGTVFVVSVSGPKMYPMNEATSQLMAKVGVETMLYQVIEVKGRRLEYTSYTVTGEVFDRFSLRK